MLGWARRTFSKAEKKNSKLIFYSLFFSPFLIINTAQASIPSSQLVGGVKGELAVSPLGNAAYSVPVDIPPGTGGMMPSLSITYDSESGNGILGMGWFISGLSVIERCPTTLVQDGVIDGVDFDSNDRFCIDGQQLIATNGVYGADGTEYRTSIESFRKIISYGVAGGGPEKFKVWTKSGHVQEYGFTTDSRIEAQGKASVLTWALNRTTDVFSNYMTVTYNEDVVNGEYSVNRMDYTGNTQNSIVPYNSVQFLYESRPDERFGYTAGAESKLTKRMSKIEVYESSTLIRDYQLEYDISATTGRSRLTSIKQCFPGSGCIEPLQFTWHVEGQGFTYAPQHNLPALMFNYAAGVAGGASLGKFSDVNGDGLADWVEAYKNIYGTVSKRTFINSGSGWQQDANYALPGLLYNYQAVSGGLIGGELRDINGDGLVDWIESWKSPSGTYQQTRTFLNTGSGWQQDTNYELPDLIDNYAAVPTGMRYGEFVDVNGDGLIDWVRSWKNPDGNITTKRTWLNTGSGWQESIPYALPDLMFNYQAVPTGMRAGGFMDVNGDGLVDWVRSWKNPDGNITTKRTWLNTGSGWQESIPYALPDIMYNYAAVPTGMRSGEFVDVNGDGLPDWVRAWKNPDGNITTKRTWINTGEGWQESIPYRLPDLIYNYAAVSGGMRYGEFVDLNGDNLLDWVTGWKNPDGNITSKRTWLNTGQGWQEDSNYQMPDMIYNYAAVTNGMRYGEFVDVNGDGIADWVQSWKNPDGNIISQKTWYASASKTDLLVAITDSLGAQTKVTYGTLVDSTLYTKHTSAVFPYSDEQIPKPVVAQIELPDGVGGSKTVAYHYEGLKFHAQGYGYLGFNKITITDNQTGFTDTSEYLQTYPFVGIVSGSESRHSNGEILVQSTSTYTDMIINHGSGIESHFPYESASSQNQYHFDNNSMLSSLLVNNATQNTYDDFGNLTQSVSTTTGNSETFTKTVDMTYINDQANWRLGLLTHTSGISTSSGKPSLTRESSFEYDSLTGVMVKTVLEPNAGNNIRLTTAVAYDNFGNVTASTICDGVPSTCTPGAIGGRTSSSIYDNRGQFLIQKTNALGHSSSLSYDSSLGAVLSSTDANGLTTQWVYDDLGRVLTETRADGTQSVSNWEWCTVAVGCPANAYYKTTNSSSGTAPVVTYYDQFHRVIRKENVSFDGTAIYVDTEYDNRGRVFRTSEPYFSGATTVFWTTPTYDTLSRITSTSYPGQSGNYLTSTTDFQGFTTVVTDTLGRSKSSTQNAIGEIVNNKDSNNSVLTYSYDSHSNLLSTSDPSFNVITNTYDILGRKLTMSDPDMGSWSYTYNAFNDLVSQTDAKNQVTTMTYDALGRMLERVDLSGSQDEQKNSWVYDTAPGKGLGKVAQAIGRPGHYADNDKSFTYDQFGRLSSVSTSMAVSPRVDVIDYSYDTSGRLETLTYPQSVVSNSRFAIKRVYNQYGYLTEVQDAANSSNVYWEASESNARGQLTKVLLGNGLESFYGYSVSNGWLSAHEVGNSTSTTLHDKSYSYDDVGNLLSRGDGILGYTEHFTYDNLDRLTSSSFIGVPSTPDYSTISYSYDALGNIASKSDIGTYSYGSCGAGPHAVCQAGTKTYSYDANGSVISSDGRQVDYWPFNKPLNITHASNPDNKVQFAYGPDRNRIARVTETMAEKIITFYIGMGSSGGTLLEVAHNQDTNVLTEKHFIYAMGNEPLAVYTLGSIGGASGANTQYYHRDHLGSVELTTDDAGSVVKRSSFDPFGNRRNSNWGADNTAKFDPNYNGLNEGYTGHEHLAEVGLTHMNGRVYDAEIGRFVSADPFIQSPNNLQSYNRYSYVQNNPLRYTDPSGYFLSSLKKHIKTVAKALGNPGDLSLMNQARKITERYSLAHQTYKKLSKEIIRQGIRTHQFNSKHMPILKRGDHYLATHRWAQMAVTAVATYYGGPYGAAGAAAHIAYAQGAGPNGILNVGQTAFISSYASQGLPSGAAGSASISDAVVIGKSIMKGYIQNKSVAEVSRFLIRNGASRKHVEYGVTALSLTGQVGKYANLPNTAIGLIYGGTGYFAGKLMDNYDPYIKFGNNAIEFLDSPFGGLGAITFGNTITWGAGEDSDLYRNFSVHEGLHTQQGEILGPLYVPLHATGMGLSLMTLPIEGTRRNNVDGASREFHGKWNFMEGPMFRNKLYH